MVIQSLFRLLFVSFWVSFKKKLRVIIRGFQILNWEERGDDCSWLWLVPPWGLLCYFFSTNGFHVILFHGVLRGLCNLFDFNIIMQYLRGRTLFWRRGSPYIFCLRFSLIHKLSFILNYPLLIGLKKNVLIRSDIKLTNLYLLVIPLKWKLMTDCFLPFSLGSHR
jgi:hypothetical protein